MNKIAESSLAKDGWLQLIGGKEVSKCGVNSFSTNMRNIGKFHKHSGVCGAVRRSGSGATGFRAGAGC